MPGGGCAIRRCARRPSAAQPEWVKLGGRAARPYLYAIARLIRSIAAVRRVSTTVRHAKPIRETRDIDVPLAARHFYSSCRLGALLESDPITKRSGRPDRSVPWNFPSSSW